jgi:Family of unknown function (DUF5681)
LRQDCSKYGDSTAAFSSPENHSTDSRKETNTFRAAARSRGYRMTAQNSGENSGETAETAPKGHTSLPEKKHKTGFRGPSPDVGKATQIQPGEVRNPGGRPKSRLLSDAYRVVLADMEKNKDRTGAELIAKSIARKAIKGDVAAAREMADRVEGKAVQKVHVGGEMDEATAKRLIELAERLGITTE